VWVRRRLEILSFQCRVKNEGGSFFSICQIKVNRRFCVPLPFHHRAHSAPFFTYYRTRALRGTATTATPVKMAKKNSRLAQQKQRGSAAGGAGKRARQNEHVGSPTTVRKAAKPRLSQRRVGGVAEERRVDRAHQQSKQQKKRMRVAESESEDEQEELIIGGADEFSTMSKKRSERRQSRETTDAAAESDKENTDTDDNDESDDELFGDDEYGVSAAPRAPRDEFGRRFVLALEKTLATRIQGR
jgi:hypothetical protein